MTRASRGLCELTPWKSVTGEADIDVGAYAYGATTWIFLMEILNPSANSFIDDAWVHFDLNKDTTGFGVVNATETIQLAVARKIDGTNWRSEGNSQGDGMTPTVTGSVAAEGRAFGLHIGPIGPTEDVRVLVALSAETGGDCEIPYVLYYRGPLPTVTAEAA